MDSILSRIDFVINYGICFGAFMIFLVFIIKEFVIIVVIVGVNMFFILLFVRKKRKLYDMYDILYDVINYYYYDDSDSGIGMNKYYEVS